MDLFKNVAVSVSKAVDYMVDKNRKAAMVNRLKIVIRNEKEVEARAYIELGKYYYENLRDPGNDRTERLCTAVDSADKRLKRAFAKLDDLLIPSGCENGEYDGEIDEADEVDAYTDEGDCTANPEEYGRHEQDDVRHIAYDDEDDDEFLRPFGAGKDGASYGGEEAAEDLHPEEEDGPSEP